jgi:hypothetical protein
MGGREGGGGGKGVQLLSSGPDRCLIPKTIKISPCKSQTEDVFAFVSQMQKLLRRNTGIENHSEAITHGGIIILKCVCCTAFLWE